MLLTENRKYFWPMEIAIYRSEMKQVKGFALVGRGGNIFDHRQIALAQPFVDGQVENMRHDIIDYTLVADVGIVDGTDFCEDILCRSVRRNLLEQLEVPVVAHEIHFLA